MASRPSVTPRAVARRVKQLTRLQYQLRIELHEVQPQVWRRLLVPEDITLIKLNVVLQQAMGWLGGHLHEYIAGRRHYGIPDEDWPGAEPMIDERRVRLNTLVESGARRFTYLYDFGDGWEHTVKIEDLVMPGAEGMKIRCLAGENACPPEDVGGPHSYFDFLMAIKDPTHEEHASMLQWIGGFFDPVAFNIKDVNERLGAIKA
jgi:Plasmid pRiA4b ORF-3-like protein